jgi:hypothetical protein
MVWGCLLYNRVLGVSVPDNHGLGYLLDNRGLGISTV